MMAANMGIKKVIVEHIPDNCQGCEFGFDNGWLDNPPKNTCILMNEELDDIVNCVIRPDLCPLVTDADLSAENKRFRIALKEIVRNEVLYLDDAYSMIEIAKDALEESEE